MILLAAIPLEVRLAVVPCRGGGEFLRRLFEPLAQYLWDLHFDEPPGHTGLLAHLDAGR